MENTEARHIWPPHGMWTGEELAECLATWDYTYKGNFTNKERDLMGRAAYGDYSWMYDKRGNPRAGWISMWNRRSPQIWEQHTKAIAKAERQERKAERKTERGKKRRNSNRRNTRGDYFGSLIADAQYEIDTRPPFNPWT